MALGVMARWPRKREAFDTHGLDRGAGGEQRRIEGRLSADRVGVEEAPGRLHLVEQVARVAPQNVGRGRRLALDELREALVEDDESFLRLRVTARRMEVR
jgi:hypothetical protein